MGFKQNWWVLNKKRWVLNRIRWVLNKIRRFFNKIWWSLHSTVHYRPFWMVILGDLDFFMLFKSVCRPLGHKPTNAPPIMTFVKLFFVFWQNTLLGSSRGFSWRSQLFWYLNCPSLHSGQFRDKKSLDLHENFLERPQ